jgi:hypothetical protein
MREGLVKVLGMVVGSWEMEFEGSLLRRMPCCGGRKKGQLATPFQRCLDGVMFVSADVVGMVVEVEVECLYPPTTSRCDCGRKGSENIIILVDKGDAAAAAAAAVNNPDAA